MVYEVISHIFFRLDVVSSYLCVFFFNHKTAFDMRISDWSSDVCSSDLTWIGPRLIQRIGHIRAFAFHAALAAVSVLLHAIMLSPWAWAALRMLTGIALVGLYTVIESWLNATAPPAQRSGVFAMYMVVNRSEEHTSELQSLMRISSA